MTEKTSKKIIALSGLRGSGKSTVGPLLAKLLGWSYADLDFLVEQSRGQGISDLVAATGWEGFRQAETETLTKALNKEKTVLSLGGGAIVSDTNYRLLKKKALIVFLACDPRAAAARINKSPEASRQRPPLLNDPSRSSSNEKSPQAEMTAIWKARRALYEQRQDLILDNSMELDSRSLQSYLKSDLLPLIHAALRPQSEN